MCKIVKDTKEHKLSTSIKQPIVLRPASNCVTFFIHGNTVGMCVENPNDICISSKKKLSLATIDGKHKDMMRNGVADKLVSGLERIGGLSFQNDLCDVHQKKSLSLFSKKTNRIRWGLISISFWWISYSCVLVNTVPGTGLHGGMARFEMTCSKFTGYVAGKMH